MGVTKSDYMLLTIMFYGPSGQEYEFSPKIVPVVASVCSYIEILCNLQIFSIIKYASAYWNLSIW